MAAARPIRSPGVSTSKWSPRREPRVSGYYHVAFWILWVLLTAISLLVWFVSYANLTAEHGFTIPPM